MGSETLPRFDQGFFAIDCAQDLIVQLLANASTNASADASADESAFAAVIASANLGAKKIGAFDGKTDNQIALSGQGDRSHGERGG